VTVPAVPAQRTAPDLYTFAPTEDEVARTPNGLRKRNPRARKATPEPVGVAAPRGSDRPAPVVDSPDDVRSHLNAFRRGVQRGSSDTLPPSPPVVEGPHR
jgi:hypothetical protein